MVALALRYSSGQIDIIGEPKLDEAKILFDSLPRTWGLCEF